jgi:hypothetical protein
MSLRKSDKCLLLIKALPHRSSRYFETVCCAGLGSDGKWRRQYPVPYRILDESQKFKRWDWIEYQFVPSKIDRRSESQKVIPESIRVVRSVSDGRRHKEVVKAIRASTDEAASKGESLTLVRPSQVRFAWRKKEPGQLAAEKLKHLELSNQTALFDKTAKPLRICPYTFYFFWVDNDGKPRKSTCDDWETSTAFFVRLKHEGTEERALRSLQKTYEEDYPKRGMAFGLGTHARRNQQWLLVGVLRIDHDNSVDLFA